MSRGKLRPGGEICADCSAADPGWASINRGVLICDECCSVHRSLGRHISHVKSLRKGLWNATQLQMVHQLVALGANNIWEHTLLDPGQSSSSKQTRRKPQAHDPLHPNKADFIRAKYLVLAFAKKQQIGDPSTLDDLNKQLHSCVRTSNLEISLRLLSQGADPNILNTERGNYPLHVAAQSGQPTQADLLVIYGADPGALDVARRTPAQNAKAEGHGDISERLLECEYELTDRLSYYLCGRRPDHINQHFIVPQMADSSLDLSELAKAAKRKLHLLSNRMFEELAMDLYDEVDRRENDAIWLSTQNHSTLITDRQSVPFLPVNPELSATRNQGRQKLARFNAREFATLVIDVLTEAKRRQLGLVQSTLLQSPVTDIHRFPDSISRDTLPDEPLSMDLSKSLSNLSDDGEPLYDEVASDDYDDYTPIAVVKARQREIELIKARKLASAKAAAVAAGKEINESLSSSDAQSSELLSISAEEFNDVKKSLNHSEAKVQQMALVNRELKQEVNKLHDQMSQLIQENSTLKQSMKSLPNGHDRNDVIHRSGRGGQSGPGRPQSMFESRDSQRPLPKPILPLVREHEVAPPSVQSQPGIVPDSHLRTSVSPQKMSDEASSRCKYSSSNNSSIDTPEYDEVYTSINPSNSNNTHNPSNPTNTSIKTIHHSNNTRSDDTRANNADPVGPAQTKSRSSQPQSSHAAPAPSTNTAPVYHPDDVMPSQDDVVRKTERITKKIQELLISAQEGKNHSYVSCSDKIHTAVCEMATIFPQKPKTENVKQALHALTTSALRLKEECRPESEETRGHVDYRLKTQQVIQCAYDIAKAAKQLVTLFQ